MNKLDEIFETLGSMEERVFMPFVTIGDPNEEQSIEIIKTLIESGADIVELGIPFSDPIADGPTIQRSSQRALNQGMNTDKAFKIVKKIRAFSDVPIVFLTYYNIVLQYPIDKFFQACKEHDVQGIVIPDLPIEEAELALKESKKNNVHIIFLIAPNTSEERLTKILEHASGFLYFVTLFGTTGTREQVTKPALDHLLKLRAISDIPVLPGFGISSPAHVKEYMDAGADGVIVGSAIVKIIEENLNDLAKMKLDLSEFVKLMKASTLIWGE